MDSILMNSENSKTSDGHIMFLNLSYKMRCDKYVALSNLTI